MVEGWLLYPLMGIYLLHKIVSRRSLYTLASDGLASREFFLFRRSAGDSPPPRTFPATSSPRVPSRNSKGWQAVKSTVAGKASPLIVRMALLNSAAGCGGRVGRRRRSLHSLIAEAYVRPAGRGRHECVVIPWPLVRTMKLGYIGLRQTPTGSLLACFAIPSFICPE